MIPQPGNLVRAAWLFAAVATCVTTHAAVSFNFGPGVAGLTAAGAGLSKLTSAQDRVAVRFTALVDGPLTEFSFGAIPGAGYASNEANAFAVVLHADQNGLPGNLVTRATAYQFNDAGARVRTARFEQSVPLKKGGVYHLVVSAPGADADRRSFGVTHARIGRDIAPVHSLDMEPTDAASALLTSTDGGATWTRLENAIATHEILIGKKAQGWGYTGTFETQLMRGPAVARYAMQTFTFTPNDGVRRAVPKRLHLALRPQGGLVGKPVKVFAHVVSPVGFHTMAEAYATVTLKDGARFETVELPFEEGALVAKANYILIIGLSEEVSATASDFLFMRGFSWGIGSPNLTHLTWQGPANCAYVSSTASSLGDARPGADLPFMIDYETTP